MTNCCRWTEPLILLLIFVNAVVLIAQAHRSVFVVGREDGFFKTWEDYVLFVLFVIFTYVHKGFACCQQLNLS